LSFGKKKHYFVITIYYADPGEVPLRKQAQKDIATEDISTGMDV